jgi:hypothetical protein
MHPKLSTGVVPGGRTRGGPSSVQMTGVGTGRSDMLIKTREAETCLRAALLLGGGPRKGKIMGLAWDCIVVAAYYEGLTVDELMERIDDDAAEE